MRIRHFGRSFERGGASLAAVSLHHALEELGVESEYFCAENSNREEARNVSGILDPKEGRFEFDDSILKKIDLEIRNELGAHAHFERFSGIRAEAPMVRLSDLATPGVDALMLHWLPGTFDWASFFDRASVPVLWRLPDLFPLTGGCHYPGACDRYRDTQGCRSCPYEVRDELVHLQFFLKRNALSILGGETCCFVAQSEWMKECMQASAIGGHIEVRVIPNGVNRSAFYKEPKDIVRRKLGLREEGFVAVICGNWKNLRKGIPDLWEKLRRESFPPNFEVVAVGTPRTEMMDAPFPVKWVSSATRDEMREIYSAGDVLLFPSLQDNCPNVVLEAHACELPCICFSNSGVKELIREGKDGILIEDGNFDSYVAALHQFVSGELEVERQYAIRSDEECARDYLELAEELVEKHRTASSSEKFSDRERQTSSAQGYYLISLVEELIRTEEEVHALDRVAVASLKECDRYRYSTFWKMTYPLRWAADRFGKKGGTKQEP